MKVKVVSVDWDITAIRNDNGEEDIFPLKYFRENFKEIEK